MSAEDPVYVVFDGDNDGWAYRYMRGWKTNDRVDFEFKDAHDLDNMTGRAQNEQYVKRHLRPRMEASGCVLVMIGEKTRYQYRYIRWELELAIDLDLPIIGVNLSGSRTMDRDRCPPIIRDHCVIHISYKKAIIKFALAKWPAAYRRLSAEVRAQGWRYYDDRIYEALGL